MLILLPNPFSLFGKAIPTATARPLAPAWGSASQVPQNTTAHTFLQLSCTWSMVTTWWTLLPLNLQLDPSLRSLTSEPRSTLFLTNKLLSAALIVRDLTIPPPTSDVGGNGAFRLLSLALRVKFLVFKCLSSTSNWLEREAFYRIDKLYSIIISSQSHHITKHLR